ncbi:MAG TPA: pyridoxal-phosphate dependent enzyme [Candidatus Dormibacteraeota bacterium]|nr:pyridoxal-phosphate dependent enzyme [Candidatus Dormibacteraeota bacterium]
MDSSISLDGIREASSTVDPVFLHSPQFDSEALSRRLGVATILKVESINPIRTFKGRGTDYLLRRLGDDSRDLVCASAGNFGQGMAYACRKAGRSLTVFVSRHANALKLDRMREMNARVELEGDDFDEAKDAARRYATAAGAMYVEDGLLGPIAEGAGSIAVELLEMREKLDAVYVPLGNGSLVNGIGTWIKHASPSTRIVAVCATAAPSMYESWKERHAISAPSTTIADGIGVRVPVADAVAIMQQTVDDVVLVSDDEMTAAMRWLFGDAGLVVEPSGAAGVAAIAARRDELTGRRVASVLTGGNLTKEQIRAWLY